MTKLRPIVIVAGVILLAWTFAFAAPPPAGTVIKAQALVNYEDAATGTYESMSSNVLFCNVSALESLILTSDRTITRDAGTVINLSHRLTNSGNVSTAYALTVSNLTGDGFDIQQPVLVRDVNGNGVADSGEPTVAAGASITLAPGEWADLVIGGIIPPTASYGTSAKVQLTAVSGTQGATTSNIDIVNISSGPSIALNKSASSLSPLPDSVDTFTITATNNGTGTADPIGVLVDGGASTYVMLRDVVPVNTTFVDIVTAGSGKALYHRFGDPDNSYLTAAPADPKTVDAVAFGFQPFGPNVTVSVSFRVRINSNANGVITNTAVLTYSALSVATSVSSNTVQLVASGVAPEIRFFTDGDYGTPATATKVGAPLYIQATASGCNLDPQLAEHRSITVGSQVTGDLENFEAIETGPNTGIFRISPAPSTRDARVYGTAAGNNIIETVPADRLTASMAGCGPTAVTTSVMVDPGGMVFDTKSNQGIAGVQVTLIDVTGNGNGGNPGAPAKVYDVDGSTSYPATVTTGADGRFSFPLVHDSTYKYQVIAPNGYAFPSTVAPSNMPPNHNIDASGSYGGNFTVSAATGAVMIDVPMDPAAASGLFIEKTALRQYVEIGEFVDYDVKVKNQSGVVMSNISVEDSLPAGFFYQKGTAQLDLKPVADPAGGVGPKLIFSIATLAAGAEGHLTYRVKVGPGAGQGDGVNHAVARTGLTASNTASARVQILDNGAFSTRGYVVGNVYGECGAGRRKGIPGVRLFLEDGTYVLTDNEGSYTFYGVQPRTHVLKLDRTTLPTGATLKVISNRQAFRPSTRFVDVKSGTLERADFAISSCSSAIEKEIAERESKPNGRPEMVAAVEQQLQRDPIVHTETEVKSRPASGMVGQGALATTATDLLGRPLTSDNKGVASVAPVAKLQPGAAKTPQPNATVEAVSTDSSLVPGLKYTKAVNGLEVPEFDFAVLDNKFGFLNLKDGQIVSAQTTVYLKGRTGSTFKLLVNGEPVSESRIGAKTGSPEKQIDIWQYIGIAMKPGPNKLEAAMVDPFGNVRGSETITVNAPGSLAKLVIEVPHVDAADDPKPVKVLVRLLDANGVPVTARTPVTLDSSDGEWKVDDVDSKTPGTQIFVINGRAELPFTPPAGTGNVRLRATAGSQSTEAQLDMLPALRPMIAAGVIDMKIDFQNLGSKSLTPTRIEDGFERDLQLLSVESDDGHLRFGSRAGVLMKGRVRGDALLTLAYDSDKASRDVMFRDIQPDEFYPVYGDSSSKGFDAQSSGKLYARLDRGKSYLLFGDFMTTDTTSERRMLTNYSRSLNGVRQHFEFGRVAVSSFASHDSLTQLVEELPANGTSGPYMISRNNAVVNSEKVEILVRDRNQPSIIVKITPQTRFTDYAFEPFTGRLLFRAPVPSLDANLNPISVRVSYEVDLGGEKFWVTGIDTAVKLTSNWKIGMSLVDDAKPGERFNMMGLTSEYKFGPKSVLSAEVGGTNTTKEGLGLGYRFEFQHEGSRLQTRMYMGRTDEDFTNLNSSLSRGRAEAAAKTTFRINSKMRLAGEFLRTEETATNGVRNGVLVTTERSFPHAVQGEIGFRHADESTAPAQSSSKGTTPNDVNALHMKMTAPMPHVKGATLFGEFEQDMTEGDKRMAAIGGKFQISERSRVYVRHEFISSFSGPFALNTGQSQNVTVIGLESDQMKTAHVFSEYRARDAFSGREAEAAIGLRNGWQIAKGIRVNTGLESVRSVEGTNDNNTLALTGGAEFTASERYKATTRLEWRDAAANKAFLSTFGFAAKLNREWTMLTRNLLATSDGKGKKTDRLQDRFQFGFAYRGRVDGNWNALMMTEYKVENDEALGASGTARNVYILSTHVNYMPIDKVTVTARYGGKLAYERSLGIETSTNAHVVGAHATYDFTKKIDVGVSANTLFTNGFNNRQYGMGSELGYLVGGNVWVSAGYNVIGFTDRDLTQEDYTKRGPYIRLRVKFDEDSLRAIAPLRKLLGQ